MTGADNEETFAAVWPGGVNAITPIAPARRSASLDGKNIGFLWDDMFRGEEIFPLIQEALVAAYDDVRFVGHETFGSIFGGDEHQVLRDLPDKLRAHGVDAVVSGVGC